MQDNYHTSGDKGETKSRSPADQLARLAELMAATHSPAHATPKQAGRTALTRFLDTGFALVRKYAPPVHAAGVFLTAMVLFFYARLVALTARIKSSGAASWPDVPTPCVLALWHGDAPSLLVALVKSRPPTPVAIMVAGDPRGDLLAVLCRMLKLEVVRGSDQGGGRTALAELAQALKRNACVIITPDGGGPARVAKPGAVVLAAAAGVSIVPVATDSHPAIQQSRKWDAARNPVPFCSLTIEVGPARRFDFFNEVESLEQARSWLETTLNTLKTQPPR